MKNTTSTNRPGFTPGRFVFTGALSLSAVLAAALSATLLAATLAGCKKEPAAPAPAAKAAGPAVNYNVRGVITNLPDPAKTSSHLMIHHEAIPDFAVNGKVVGMAEMTMPFPTATGLSLSGLAVGDPVSFTMEVIEKPVKRYQITRIEKLPAETKLEFKAPPAAPSSQPH